MNMNEYEQQAIDFLEKTETRFSVKFLRIDKYFYSDKEVRAIYEFTLERKGRKYTSTFGDSITSTWQALIGKMPQRICIYDQKKFDAMVIKANKTPNFPMPLPKAYDILSVLEKYEIDPDVDSWAHDMGYELGKETKIKDILAIHQACKEQYQGLISLYNENEMELLREIQ